MGVEISIAYTGSLFCRATHGPSGKSLVTEAPADNGGKGESFSPTDLLATAAGTCIATVMGIAARKEGYDLEGLRVHVIKEMTAEAPRRVAKLKIVVDMPADRRFSPAERERLETVARQCPVKRSLHPDVAIELEFMYAD